MTFSPQLRQNEGDNEGLLEELRLTIIFISLLIIFMINHLVYFLKKCENAHHSSPENKMTSSNCYFVQPEPKDALFSIINDTGNEQIFAFKKLQPAKVE